MDQRSPRSVAACRSGTVMRMARLLPVATWRWLAPGPVLLLLFAQRQQLGGRGPVPGRGRVPALFVPGGRGDDLEHRLGQVALAVAVRRVQVQRVARGLD